MKTAPQIERKYTKLRKLGDLVEGAPAYAVVLTIDNQSFELSPGVDRVTADWLRRQLGLALYKFAALEGDHGKAKRT